MRFAIREKVQISKRKREKIFYKRKKERNKRKRERKKERNKRKRERVVRETRHLAPSAPIM